MNDRRGEVLLQASGLRVARGPRDVVQGIDFELRVGEIAALLGPNGAGKSTLLEALAGLLPLAAGHVEASGRVALALQSPDLAKRTVVANVQLALCWWGVPRGERRERAESALEAMQASHLRDRPGLSLSGGERRRVHLACAVSVRPDIMLLDEPFAGLDAATRATLLDDTGAALRAWAATTLVVVHDRAEAWALADRLLVMIDGRLVADGPPRELLSRPPSVEVARFLGFDGTLADEDGQLLLTRTQHVVPILRPSCGRGSGARSPLKTVCDSSSNSSAAGSTRSRRFRARRLETSSDSPDRRSALLHERECPRSGRGRPQRSTTFGDAVTRRETCCGI